jgi:hypothetical protein
MALQDRLDAFKADFESGSLSAEAHQGRRLDTMQRATAELIASGQAQRASKAGDVAPEFTLNDPDGKPVSSREPARQGTAGHFVLSRRLVPLLQSRTAGAAGSACRDRRLAAQALVAISPQTAANSRKSQRDNKLGFPDPERHQKRSRQRVRHSLRAAGLSGRDSTRVWQEPAGVQRRSVLGVADAGALS